MCFVPCFTWRVVCVNIPVEIRNVHTLHYLHNWYLFILRRMVGWTLLQESEIIFPAGGHHGPPRATTGHCHSHSLHCCCCRTFWMRRRRLWGKEPGTVISPEDLVGVGVNTEGFQLPNWRLISGKRAWNSNFHGGLGKRRWNSNFSGGNQDLFMIWYVY